MIAAFRLGGTRPDRAPPCPAATARQGCRERGDAKRALGGRDACCRDCPGRVSWSLPVLSSCRTPAHLSAAPPASGPAAARPGARAAICRGPRLPRNRSGTAGARRRGSPRPAGARGLPPPGWPQCTSAARERTGPAPEAAPRSASPQPDRIPLMPKVVSCLYAFYALTGMLTHSFGAWPQFAEASCLALSVIPGGRPSAGGSACGAAAWVGAAVEAPCAFSREGLLSHHAEG
jgi:hypothetical protein